MFVRITKSARTHFVRLGNHIGKRNLLIAGMLFAVPGGSVPALIWILGAWLAMASWSRLVPPHFSSRSMQEKTMSSNKKWSFRMTGPNEGVFRTPDGPKIVRSKREANEIIAHAPHIDSQRDLADFIDAGYDARNCSLPDELPAEHTPNRT